MTHIDIYRDIPAEGCTIGSLYWDNVFFCNTLEDIVRVGDDLLLEKSEKVFGETAIPTGAYEVVLGNFRGTGKMYPMLKDVPLFDGIYFHGGNRAEDTMGCILVGMYDPSQPNRITNSRNMFMGRFLPAVTDALSRNKVWCRITGGQRQAA